MQRRSLLKGSLAAAVVSAIPLGAVRAQEGRTSIALALPLEPPSLDPTMQPSNAVGQVTLYNIFETLTRMNEDGTIHPCLAESWETADSKEYTFKLVKGVTFHDGSPFTSADVKFTFERNASDKSTNKRKRIFTNMASIETPDDHTVHIVLKTPSRLLPTYLSEATGAIVSPKTADKNGTNPVGTGPYAFTDWVQGDSVKMTKYAEHRNAADIQIETATMRFMSDANAQLNALLSGGVDWIPNFQAPESLARVRENKQFRVTVGPSASVMFVGFNNEQAPLDDVRVRRALTHAIDRQLVIEGAMSGLGTPIGTHMTPAYPYYIDLTDRYPYDPQKARDLLAEAGHANGLQVNLKVPPTPTYQRCAEIVAAMLAQVGVQATLEPYEWAQWLDVVFRQKAYDLTVISQPEPWTMFNYTDPNYFYQYDSAAYNELCQKAEASTSEEEFTGHIHAALTMLTEDAASGWLFEVPMVNVVRSDIEGIWTKAPILAFQIGNLEYS